MGYDKLTAERVRRILVGRSDVLEKKMVGGIVHDAQPPGCGLTSSGFVARVGPAAYERMLASPNMHPMKFAGKALRGFAIVDPVGYATRAALAGWVQHYWNVMAAKQ